MTTVAIRSSRIVRTSVAVWALTVGCLSLSACIIVDVHSSEPTPTGNDYSSLNSPLRIEANERAGDVSSVNGDIELLAGASVDRISSVNGDIALRRGAQAAGIESVNGEITLDDAARVLGAIDSVNGSITLTRASVGGSVSVVNAEVQLRESTVEGNLSTVQADVRLLENSAIAGNLIVRASQSKGATVTIALAAGARIRGTLILEQPANVIQDPGATIGSIERRY